MKTVMIIITLILTVSVKADESPFSTSITLTSDYVYRGISQTNGNPAFQIMPKYQIKDGWHMVGFFAPVDYGGKNTANFEYDVALGYEWSNNELYWNARLWRFNYRDQQALNTTEFRVYGTYKKFDFTYGYSNDTCSTEAYGHHFELGLSQPVWQNYQVRGHVGHSFFEENPYYKDYYHFKLTLSGQWQGMNLGVSYSDTYKGEYGELDDTRWFIHLTKNF